MFNENTRTKCELCSKLTLKTPDSGIDIIKFKILQLFWYFIVDFDTVLLLVYCITQFDESHIDGF